MEYGHILASFEKLNPFNKLNSKCQYNSIKTCHSNKTLNTHLTTICKAGAVIEMPFQILSHSKVEKYLNFLSNHITPSLFKHVLTVLFLHFKSQFFTNYIFGKTKDYSFEIQLNFIAGLCTVIFKCPLSRLNKCPSYILPPLPPDAKPVWISFVVSPRKIESQYYVSNYIQTNTENLTEKS